METRYLEQLIAIKNSRSMREAAEKLFVSQTTLSHDLKRIEEELGCQLFDRSRNQLTLNAYGTIMLEHAQRIVEELETAKTRIAEEKMRQAQRVSVGVWSYAFQSFVLPSIANAVKENVFESHICESAALAERLKDGSLDVIFTDREVSCETLNTVRLFKEQIILSLPSTCELASRQSIFLADLEKLDIYFVSDASGYSSWFQHVLGLAHVDLSKVNRVPFKEYLYTKDKVEQCYLTSSFILRFLPTTAGRVALPLAEEVGFRNIYMAYKKQEEKRLMPMLSYVERHQDQLFTGNAFLPYFLFPEQSNNLLICSTTE